MGAREATWEPVSSGSPEDDTWSCGGEDLAALMSWEGACFSSLREKRQAFRERLSHFPQPVKYTDAEQVYFCSFFFTVNMFLVGPEKWRHLQQREQNTDGPPYVNVPHSV